MPLDNLSARVVVEAAIRTIVAHGESYWGLTCITASTADFDSAGGSSILSAPTIRFLSSAGQSIWLITGRSRVRSPEEPPT